MSISKSDADLLAICYGRFCLLEADYARLDTPRSRLKATTAAKQLYKLQKEIGVEVVKYGYLQKHYGIESFVWPDGKMVLVN